jgi:hypothetical protein
VRDFLDRVAVPRGNPHHDRSLADDLALARETAVPLQARGLFDTVLLGLGRLGQLVHALLDVDVAGRAGADAAAGVLDVDSVLDREFEQALALGAHQIPLLLLGLGETLRILEQELDGNDRRAVDVVGVAKVHGC